MPTRFRMATHANAALMADNDNVRPKVDLYFLSPCPPGYDTVLGWIAKNNPGLLDLIDRVPEATQRDGFWLKHRCREQGLEVIKVDACAFLSKQGIKSVNSYPIHLLNVRFSD